MLKIILGALMSPVFAYAASGMQTNLVAPWYDRVSVGGEFRYRHEYIDQEEVASSNHRQRMRVRLNAKSQINAVTKTFIQLTSSSAAPDSTHLSYDEGYTKKALYIDMAYFTWAPNETTQLHGGKVRNTLYIPEGSTILWEPNLTFEGFTLNQETSRGEYTYLFNLGAYWFQERDSESSLASSSERAHSDIFQYSPQLGMKWSAQDRVFKAVLGLHAVAPIQNQQAPKSNGQFIYRGNTFDLTDANDPRYEYNYQITELAMNYALPVKGRALSLTADFIRNTATPEENNGYLVGFTLGQLLKKGDWLLGYNYRDLEKDATLAALTDGDFAGGETDSRGHKFHFRYQLADGVVALFTYFKTERDLTTTPVDYDRIQIDGNFNF